MKENFLTSISESAKLVINTFVTVCMALFRQTTTRRRNKKKNNLNFFLNSKINTYKLQEHFQLYQRKK